MPGNIEDQIKGVATSVGSLNKQVSDLQTNVSQLLTKQTGATEQMQTTIVAINNRMDGLLGRFQKIEADLGALSGRLKPPEVEVPPVRPSMSFDVLSDHLRQAVERVNEKYKAGTSPMLVDRLEVELKAGVDVSDGVKLTPLLAQELKPEGLSCLRFSLRAAAPMKFPE